MRSAVRNDEFIEDSLDGTAERNGASEDSWNERLLGQVSPVVLAQLLAGTGALLVIVGILVR